MIVATNKYCKVIKTDDGRLTITRHRPFGGGDSTHSFTTEYSAEEVADYLHDKAEGRHTQFIQVLFPNMSPEDREFLLTGITPEEWNNLFGDEPE
jgi:hypothetical protein